MKTHIINLMVPLVGGAISVFVTSVAFWESNLPYLLTTLSVVAAGVLIRLARGIPFSLPDYLTLQDANDMANAMKQSVRALRTLAVVVFLAIVLVISAKGLLLNLQTLLSEEMANDLITFAIGLVLTFISVRLLSVINGDVGLVDMQSKFLEEKAKRNLAADFKQLEKKAAKVPFKSPDGYGGRTKI